MTVAFELNGKPEGAPEANAYYLLAWTTTPWTLPSNLALAVSGEMEYVCVERDGALYMIGKGSLASYAKELGVEEDAELPTISGSALIGAKFLPLFPYFVEHEVAEKSFRVLDGSCLLYTSPSPRDA